jgi:hypothetical protein
MATMQYDVWSVKVGSDADFYVVENTYAGTLPLSLPLANTIPGRNGYGYKVSVTSAGDDTGVGFYHYRHQGGRHWWDIGQ